MPGGYGSAVHQVLLMTSFRGAHAGTCNNRTVVLQYN